MSSYSFPPAPNQAQPPPQGPQYADGLEVVPPSDPPEWIAGGAEDQPGKDKEAAHEVYQLIQPVSRPWWKRKVVLIGIAVVVVVAVGLGAGLGVGLSSKKSSSDEGSPSDGSRSGGPR